MQRSHSYALMAMGLIAVGCSDERPVPVAPLEPPAALLVAQPTVQDLRAQIDALLQDPARTWAQFALSRVDTDIRYRRPTLYMSSLLLAGIALKEREDDHIPSDKIDRLLKFLCDLVKVIGPSLPPSFPRIDWCNVDPKALGNDATFRVVTNALGGTVTTPTKKFSLGIAASSIKDAAGNPVPALFVAVLPLKRGTPTTAEPFPCPEPWDEERFPQSQVDCYPEFYELAVQPPVQFIPKARLSICQKHPGLGSAQSPPPGVPLELFSKDGNNNVRVVGAPPETPLTQANCADRPELHTLIGPPGLSPQGMRNAFLKLARFGADVLNVFRPTPLNATNLPTHGGLGSELLPAAGNVMGAIDDLRTRCQRVSCGPN